MEIEENVQRNQSKPLKISVHTIFLLLLYSSLLFEHLQAKSFAHVIQNSHTSIEANSSRYNRLFLLETNRLRLTWQSFSILLSRMTSLVYLNYIRA